MFNPERQPDKDRSNSIPLNRHNCLPTTIMVEVDRSNPRQIFDIHKVILRLGILITVDSFAHLIDSISKHRVNPEFIKPSNRHTGLQLKLQELHFVADGKDCAHTRAVVLAADGQYVEYSAKLVLQDKTLQIFFASGRDGAEHLDWQKFDNICKQLEVDGNAALQVAERESHSCNYAVRIQQAKFPVMLQFRQTEDNDQTNSELNRQFFNSAGSEQVYNVEQGAQPDEEIGNEELLPYPGDTLEAYYNIIKEVPAELFPREIEFMGHTTYIYNFQNIEDGFRYLEACIRARDNRLRTSYVPVKLMFFTEDVKNIQELFHRLHLRISEDRTNALFAAVRSPDAQQVRLHLATRSIDLLYIDRDFLMVKSANMQLSKCTECSWHMSPTTSEAPIFKIMQHKTRGFYGGWSSLIQTSLYIESEYEKKDKKQNPDNFFKFIDKLGMRMQLWAANPFLQRHTQLLIEPEYKGQEFFCLHDGNHLKVVLEVVDRDCFPFVSEQD